MTEQPGDVLGEAVKLLDALCRRVGGAAGAWSAPGGRGGDVWARATAPDADTGPAADTGPDADPDPGAGGAWASATGEDPVGIG
ncbi:hypothetical protein [Spirillospora sp. NBC_01491]|uniref:hypothetical protein n=1 Tax=Spirillospora sp. NBC_01491 TaxID=2976007 RepID=UPI002E2EAEDC|nr:hypothetical protein [Spirillospora sp. NBC_01491]